MKITGKTLIGWGHAPGSWFAGALAAAQAAEAQGATKDEIRAIVAGRAPPPRPPAIPPQKADDVPVFAAIEAGGPDELANVVAVEATMRELARTPTVTGLAIMPDACPAGPFGTIPVGGVVAARGAIHPGMHSADICCSVAITVLRDADPARTLDAAERATHFGGGGRASSDIVRAPKDVLAPFATNEFLRGAAHQAASHFATQGDGNHFLFVGRLRSTGETAIVTHHGSRGPGARLYKAGMAVAERFRRLVSPETRPQNAWIPAESAEGEAYWAALQAIRAWTKASHFALHERTRAALGAKAAGRFWNEHNFVFRRGDAILHGKGATPAWADYAGDATGEVLIPLNMGEPVLIARGSDRAEALGFCPHGAGRNVSRSEHLRRQAGRSEAEIVAAETRGLDVRFFCGAPDVSELPSAYKPAGEVVRQIDAFGLAEVVDHVDPFGSIMAGDWKRGFQNARGGAEAG